MTPHDSAASTLTLLLLAITLGYSVGCWIWPFRACRRCAGTGKKRSPSGRAFRACPSCRGTGAKLRAGRWIYNQLTRLRKDGTR